ncbi:nuclear transport factor 2 family protein [Chloroflexota bacterium]
MSQEQMDNVLRSLEEMNDKLRVLEDIEEIKKLHTNYVYWMCNHRWDDMLNCFTEDAVLNVQGDERRGKEEIEDLFKHFLADRIKLNDGHIVGQPVINVEGDKATGYWILYLFFSDPVSWMQGRQECEYVRDYGKWKFQTMRFINPWPELPV